MADPGVGEETREGAVDASADGGGEVLPSHLLTGPDVEETPDEPPEERVDSAPADVAQGESSAARAPVDASASGGSPDRPPPAAGSGDAGQPAGEAVPGEDAPADRRGSDAAARARDGGAAGGDDRLPVGSVDSEVGPQQMDPGAIRVIRENAKRQAENDRENASRKAAEVVRVEVRRVLGLDHRPTFEAESVSHVIGLVRDGEPVDPELEKELRAELDGLGIDLAGVHLRYETMSEDDRRALTTFEVQQEFLRVVERVDNLATQASVSLGHRIRMFNAQAQDQLKLVAGLTVLIETQQKQVEDVIAGFRQKMQKETESFEDLVRAEKTKLTGKVQEVLGSFGQVFAEAQSCQKVSVSISEKLESAGQVSESLKDEASRVMSELNRVAGEGIAVRRLALLGGVIGSAAGGFFAFVVLLLLWAVTSG